MDLEHSQVSGQSPTFSTDDLFTADRIISAEKAIRICCLAHPDHHTRDRHAAENP